MNYKYALIIIALGAIIGLIVGITGTKKNDSESRFDYAIKRTAVGALISVVLILVFYAIWMIIQDRRKNS